MKNNALQQIRVRRCSKWQSYSNIPINVLVSFPEQRLQCTIKSKLLFSDQLSDEGVRGTAGRPIIWRQTDTFRCLYVFTELVRLYSCCISSSAATRAVLAADTSVTLVMVPLAPRRSTMTGKRASPNLACGSISTAPTAIFCLLGAIFQVWWIVETASCRT